MNITANQQIAKLNDLHIAPRKVRLIANVIKGLRTQEAEADRVGIGFLAEAGFDPNGMPTFFWTLQQRYGAGTTMIWDEGTYATPGSGGRAEAEQAFHAGLEKGTIKLVLKGTKLEGQFALVRLKDGDGRNWLLIKDRDAFSTPRDILELDRSARTGRCIEK